MSAPAAKQWIIDLVLAGGVVCNTGQVDGPTKRALDKLTRDGTLVTWRGRWFPVAGAQLGIGPLKTCWGLASKFGSDQRAAT